MKGKKKYTYKEILKKEKGFRKHPYLDLLRFIYLEKRWKISAGKWFKYKLYHRKNTRPYLAENNNRYKRSWSRMIPVAAADRSALWKAFHYLRFGIFRLIYPGLDAKDYFDYRFWDLSNNHAYRKTFITEGGLRKMENIFNGSESCAEEKEILRNKMLFNEFFSEMLGREWIAALPGEENKAEIREFLEGCSRVIVKPLKSAHGKGIFAVNMSEEGATERVLAEIGHSSLMVEEWIEQSEEMAALNPSTVNTIRVNTVRDGDDIIITGAVLRIGRSGMSVDNFCSGGIAVLVDRETGKACGSGRTKYGGRETETDAGVALNGFTIPEWPRVLQICLDAHSQLKKLRYIGWDVAISAEHGPVLIEGNTFAGIDFQQSLDLKGKKSLYQSFLHNGERL